MSNEQRVCDVRAGEVEPSSHKINENPSVGGHGHTPWARREGSCGACGVVQCGRSEWQRAENADAVDLRMMVETPALIAASNGGMWNSLMARIDKSTYE